MEKDFVYTIRIKDTGKLLVEEIVTFGTKEYPFPSDWKKNGVAISALEQYRESFVQNHLDVSYKEFDSTEESEKMDKIYFSKDCIDFALWLRDNDTQENAEDFANFSDEDMLDYWTKNVKNKR